VLRMASHCVFRFARIQLMVVEMLNYIGAQLSRLYLSTCVEERPLYLSTSIQLMVVETLNYTGAQLSLTFGMLELIPGPDLLGM
jgi:hypothetical protein